MIYDILKYKKQLNEYLQLINNLINKKNNIILFSKINLIKTYN